MGERVVLLGIDGLDWSRLRAGVSAGRLPVFAELLETGAYAEVAVTPCVPVLAKLRNGLNSPTLWTTIATGQYYFQHGVFEFLNLFESPIQPPLFASRHVRTPRMWDVLSQYQHTSLVFGYYVTHPATALQGLMVSDLFGDVDDPSVVWPAERLDEMARALGAPDYAAYRRGQGRLGTDVGIEQVCQGAPEQAELRKSAERILREFTSLPPQSIARLLAGDGDANERRLLEYRLIYPVIRDERFHRLLLRELPRGDWTLATIYYRTIDFVSHGFWTEGHSLAPSFQHAYGEVIDRAYARADAWVGEIRGQLAPGDRLIVLSDHGFRTNPTAADATQVKHIADLCRGDHAEPAVLIVSGGGRRGRVDGVSLLDIAPSVYDLVGIPPAASLDGGAVPGLLHAGAPRGLPPVSSYAAPPGCQREEIKSEEQDAIRRRLADLGYLE